MSQSKIKIAIVDDHKLFREGIASLLEDFKELQICFMAEDGKDFLEQLAGNGSLIDVVLLDVEMPELNGIDVLKKLRVDYPAIKPLVLTMHNDDELIYELVGLGAKGFLPKSSDIEEVADAIRTLNENELYFNEDVSKKVIKKLVKTENSKKEVLNATLSEREIEVIKLICRELTTKEISSELFISERTVETHKRSILNKTKTKNSAGIAMYAIRVGIID